MGAPNYSYTPYGPVYGGTPVPKYVPLVQDTAGYFRPSTAANRALYGRTKAIAMASYSGVSDNVLELQFIGPVDNGLNLGTGAPDRWCRANDAGALEVFTPANGGTSDVVGKVDQNGLVTLELGVWTETMAYNAVNGGLGFTPPTGTGLMTVTGGVVDAASLAAGASGNVPVSDGTKFNSGVLPIASTSGTLAVGRGGTGVTALPGSSTQMLYNNGGALGATANVLSDGTISNSGSPLINGNASAVYVGTTSAFAGGNQTSILNMYSGTAWAAGIGGVTYTYITSALAAQQYWQPIIGGYSSGSHSPFRLGVLSITQSSTATTTLSTTQSCYPEINVTGTPGGAFAVVAPLSSGAAYDVYNGTNQTMTFGGSSGATVSIPTLTKARCVCFDGANYR